jgi:hypothetical protein
VVALSEAYYERGSREEGRHCAALCNALRQGVVGCRRMGGWPRGILGWEGRTDGVGGRIGGDRSDSTESTVWMMQKLGRSALHSLDKKVYGALWHLHVGVTF